MIKENTSLLMRGLLIVLFGLGLSAQQISAQDCAVATTAQSQNISPNAAITSTAPVVVISDITISGFLPVIVDLNVLLNITHTNSGNLDITLESPDGTIVTLTSDNGGTNDNVFNGTIWDDAAAERAVGATYTNNVPKGTLSPEEPLAAFYGENPNGVWRLTVSDDATNDGGTLAGWSLNFKNTATVPALVNTIASNNNPVFISEDGTSTVTSDIEVNGAEEFFVGATITTNITHSFNSDLTTISITAPNGESVVLAAANGGSNDNVFAGTVWSVDADPGNEPPFSAGTFAASNIVTDGTYTDLTLEVTLTPRQGFEKFFGDNPNGTWTLTVIDGADGDGGAINSWSISINALNNLVCELAAAPDVTISTDPGEATGSYTATPPALVETLTGNCDNAVVTVSLEGQPAQPAGTVFNLPVGTNNFEFTVTSDCGFYTDEFVVTVEDNEDPVILNCPADLTYTLAPGECDHQFDLVLNATDNAGINGLLTASQEVHVLVNQDDSPVTVSVSFVDDSGNSAICEFDLIVNPFPTPITSLICDDLVTVSLDESCELVLNADQVLEGGPYHCYDDYIVQLDRTLPLGNGPWVAGVLGPNDVHKTWAVRVVDDVNGNGQYDPGEVTCWGNIAIEDKLPPVFEDCGCTPGAVEVPSYAGALTDNSPTFNRTFSGGPPCGLTGIGTDVAYDAFTFEVTTAGEYTFSEVSFPEDGFGILYADSFDPNNPCDNFIVASDDEIGDDFEIIETLAPGTYVLVITTFSNGDFGSFTVDISPSVFFGEPSNCAFTCADKDGILNGSIAVPLPTVTDNCSTPTLTKKDVYVDGGPCGTGHIYRTWTATDAWGNSSQCTQDITLDPYTLDDVTFPEDVTIDCQGCGLTAGTKPCITGVPTVEGNDADDVYELIQYNGNCVVLSEGLCNLGAQYHDTKIDVCAGTFKILRHWTVLDWCTSEVSEHDQLIKVVDDEGPSIATPADMTVSTNPSQCCATVNLPDVIIEDNCSPTA
ncbi:MAG: proprotein convertase P-domain-containing protein, partial [Saprospiraceae bacterium]|nr:proprotein convertase P-domain-containing protein [Saprospiraceae bacterium]